MDTIPDKVLLLFELSLDLYRYLKGISDRRFSCFAQPRGMERVKGSSSSVLQLVRDNLILYNDREKGN